MDSLPTGLLSRIIYFLVEHQPEILIWAGDRLRKIKTSVLHAAALHGIRDNPPMRCVFVCQNYVLRSVRGTTSLFRGRCLSYSRARVSAQDIFFWCLELSYEIIEGNREGKLKKLRCFHSSYFAAAAVGVGLFKKGVRAVQAVSRASRFLWRKNLNHYAYTIPWFFRCRLIRIIPIFPHVEKLLSTSTAMIATTVSSLNLSTKSCPPIILAISCLLSFYFGKKRMLSEWDRMDAFGLSYVGRLWLYMVLIDWYCDYFLIFVCWS